MATVSSIGTALAALAAAGLLAACIPPTRAAEPLASPQACWDMVGELAASAVFSDLEEETMEEVSRHLDTLQDHCADARLAEATREIAAIEAIIGK